MYTTVINKVKKEVICVIKSGLNHVTPCCQMLRHIFVDTGGSTNTLSHSPWLRMRRQLSSLVVAPAQALHTQLAAALPPDDEVPLGLRVSAINKPHRCLLRKILIHPCTISYSVLYKGEYKMCQHVLRLLQVMYLICYHVIHVDQQISKPQHSDQIIVFKFQASKHHHYF